MQNNIKIPHELGVILDPDYTLSGFVKSSVSEFSPWLQENNVKFFSEYTDHSLRHVEGVLETADKLIRENCRAIVTAGDVATLILASFLHDCAMHLSVDGFATLIGSDKKIEGFNDKPWSMLWEDFIAESRRFSGRKLMSLFGDTEPIHPPRDLDSHKLTGRDLLLIGEFLRRHHHRLAHEIAVYGVPGPDVYKLKLPEKEETEHIVELAGVVARSHGLPIRSCNDYLLGKYSSFRIYKGVHPVFLMALLRIADILQLQSIRAPRQVQKVRSLRSPISKGEWEMHQAIKYINWTDHPETILIHAIPPNARTFLRIKDLLTQIQHELDSSWAVMSEAYYPEESLRALGLTIRCVRSNLDDEEKFAKKVKYFPCHAAFGVADTDLLKLLIGPLYGEKPEIGIRELLQNSIDAVRECRVYLEKHPELEDVEFTDQEADVVVSIDEEEDGWWVTVSDKGIGMTLDTVRNYFLKAGASLRRSEIWRKTFENEEGKSQVLRSGRFGVGVLAAFLLGSEVNVSTRYINEPEDNGIFFSAELNAEAVELQRKKRPVGTTVCVRISNNVKDELLLNQYRWDWYCLKEPKILFTTEHGSNKLHQEYHLPSLNTDLPIGWHRITHPDYQDIHWTYSEAPNLTCNGIKIEKLIYTADDIFEEKDTLWEGWGFYIKKPKVSVFDYDANLPLNLLRTGLTQEKYPFHEELLNDIFKDLIAFSFVNAPFQHFPEISSFEWCLFHKKYPGIDDSLHYMFPWLYTKFGISIANDPWHIRQIDASYALLVQLYRHYSLKDISIHNVVAKSSSIVFASRISSDIDYEFGEAKELKVAINNAFNIFFWHEKLKHFFTSGRRALISCHVLKHMEKELKFEQEVEEIQEVEEKQTFQIVEEWNNKNWVLWRIGDCPAPGFDFEKFAAENDGKNFDEWPCVLAEWYFKEPKPQLEESELSPLAKVWRDVVGSPIIPFDLEERRKMKAYKELKPYIEAHEKMRKQKKW